MENVITDKAGRRLTLRKVGVLETLRLYKALGPELSENNAYMGLARVASSVAMIDDMPLLFPKNESGIEECLSRLGEEGTEAVEDAIFPASLETVVRDAGN